EGKLAITGKVTYSPLEEGKPHSVAQRQCCIIGEKLSIESRTEPGKVVYLKADERTSRPPSNAPSNFAEQPPHPTSCRDHVANPTVGSSRERRFEKAETIEAIGAHRRSDAIGERSGSSIGKQIHCPGAVVLIVPNYTQR